MTKKKSIIDSNFLYTLIAIIIGFIVGAIFLLVANISPAVAYGKLIDGVIGKPKYWIWTLEYAAPIILTGLSVAFSFKTGVFNIGAEGQFVVGSMVAAVAGILLDLPPVLHAIVCLVLAGLAGMAWSLIVGVLKVKRGIHEVLSFIMFNWIAFYLSNYVVNLAVIHKEGGGEASKDIKDSASILLPEAIRNALGLTSASWGFIIAVVAAIVIFVILEKTSLGFNLKAVGLNRNGAEYAGIDANKSILMALGISGLLSGLGGAVQILGMAGRLSQYASQEGFGFEGITVALIASSNPLGCILSGIFYGAMKYGGSKLSIIKAPAEIVDIIMGCVILVIAIAQIFKFLLKNAARKKESK